MYLNVFLLKKNPGKTFGQHDCVTSKVDTLSLFGNNPVYTRFSKSFQIPRKNASF